MNVGEALLGVAVAALGVALAGGTYALPEAPGYSQVGPKLFPALVAAGLILTGVVLVREAWAGGYRNLPDEARDPLDGVAFAWTLGGVLAHAALIGIIGFIAASTLLFVACARGFASRRLVRDALAGLALSACLYGVFTFGLGLGLGPVIGAR